LGADDARVLDAGLDAVALVLAALENRVDDEHAIVRASKHDAGPLIGGLVAVARDLVRESGQDPQEWAARYRAALGY
jgi:hypothetical protein